MKKYLRWGFRELYLFLFCPTRYEYEHERKYGARDGVIRTYIAAMPGVLKMIPWTVALTVLGTLITGYACELFGVHFDWRVAWNTVLFATPVAVVLVGGAGDAGSAVFGSMLGFVFGAVGGVWSEGIPGAGSVAVVGAMFGAALGAVFGTGFGAAILESFYVREAALFGAAAIVVISFVLSLLYGAVGGASVGKVFGLSFCLACSVTFFRLLTYPLDVVLSVAAYLVGRRRPGAAERAWRWCPLAWNELIWLPLPFADRLLALLAKQDREAGLGRIAFVFTERPFQRRAALAALAELAVADLKAESLSQLSDVTDRLSWTTDAPANLPDELSTTLPRFDRVAQHVGQYLTLHNAYRKRESLERAIKEVEALQRSLIAARGRFAPRMLQAVNEWRGLLDAERDKARALAEASREIPNPFVYGNPVTETEYNVFTGRGDVVKQIEASLLGAAQAPTLLLQGPRRMGKTSILNQLPRLLGPDFAPALVDCQNPAVTGSEATLLRYLSRALSEGLRRKRVVVEALAAQQLAREPYAVFDEWLEKVERAMPVGMKALLCLDEYERLQRALEAGWGATFLDALRHTFQHRPRVVLMFTGAHTFQELGPAWTDRFVSARRMRVSFLTRADVELLLTKPIPEFDMTYAAGALDTLIAATNCHPFLTQAVAFELVQLLNESQQSERREATPEDVEEAIGRALASGEAYFANVWGDAGAEGQAILSALASGRTPPEFPAASAWLREHDVVGADGDFAVEMLRRWVASKATGV